MDTVEESDFLYLNLVSKFSIQAPLSSTSNSLPLRTGFLRRLERPRMQHEFSVIDREIKVPGKIHHIESHNISGLSNIWIRYGESKDPQAIEQG